MIVHNLVLLIKVQKIIGKIEVDFTEARRKYMISCKRAFTVLKCTWMWKRRYKKFGGSLSSIHKNTIRQRLVFVTSPHYFPFFKKSLKPIKFLLGVATLFKIKLMETTRIVRYIQKK